MISRSSFTIVPVPAEPMVAPKTLVISSASVSSGSITSSPVTVTSMLAVVSPAGIRTLPAAST